MEQTSILLNQISMFAVMLVTGFLARKTKLADKSVFDALTAFTVRVLLPLFMLTTLPGAGTDVSILRILLLISTFAVFYILMLGTAALSNKIFRMKGKMGAENMTVITTTCAGFIGIPIAGAMYGGYGVLIMALYSAFDNFAMWTHKAYVLGSFNGEAGRGREKGQWKKLINPQLIAVLLGILLAAWKVDLSNNVAWDALTKVGDMAKYMGMLFLGSTLGDIDKTSLHFVRPTAFIVAARMVALPILAGLVLVRIPLFNHKDTVMLVLILATPPMASVPTIIRSFGMDEKYSAQALILTTMISLATVPIVLRIFL